ncbi:hypothetical protein TNCV_252121 [Trichonephila clavipes]|nr:hypothetical protein TNCV_252121 [Trichonephila clavipes]
MHEIGCKVIRIKLCLRTIPECDARRVLVCLERRTRNNQIFVQERSHYRIGDLRVWTDISIGGRTDLHIVRNRNSTAQRYANEILRPYAVPYVAAISDSSLLMQDNARNRATRLMGKLP